MLVPVFFHQGELPGHDRHDCFLGDGIRVVGDSAAGSVVLVFEHVAAKDVPGDVEQSRLRRGEEGLPEDNPEEETNLEVEQSSEEGASEEEDLFSEETAAEEDGSVGEDAAADAEITEEQSSEEETAGEAESLPEETGDEDERGGDIDHLRIAGEDIRQHMTQTYHQSRTDGVHQQAQMDRRAAGHTHGRQVAMP